LRNHNFNFIGSQPMPEQRGKVRARQEKSRPWLGAALVLLGAKCKGGGAASMRLTECRASRETGPSKSRNAIA